MRPSYLAVSALHPSRRQGRLPENQRGLPLLPGREGVHHVGGACLAVPVSCDQRSVSNGRRLGAEEGAGSLHWEPHLIVGLGNGSRRADASGEDRHLPAPSGTYQRLETHLTPGRPEDVSEAVSSPLLVTSPGSRRVLRGGASHGRLSSLAGVAVPPVGPLATCEACVVVALSSRRCCHRRTSSRVTATTWDPGSRAADAAVRRFVLSAQLHVDVA